MVQPVASQMLKSRALSYIATVSIGCSVGSAQAQEHARDSVADQPTPGPSPSVSAPMSVDQPLHEADKNIEEWKAEHAKWQRKQFADSANGLRVKFNQEFTLGDYSYKITDAQPFKSIGPELMRETASDGAIFLVVHYLIRNDGKRTAETDANDFRLVALDGREYSPDSRATNAVSPDFLLRELHPGVYKKAVVAFEVPAEVITTSFKIVIPEKGLFKEKRQSAFLLLTPNPSNAAPERSKSKGQTRIRGSADGASRRAGYEEMRREILLHRPPGTSSTDYDPDWH